MLYLSGRYVIFYAMTNQFVLSQYGKDLVPDPDDGVCVKTSFAAPKLVDFKTWFLFAELIYRNCCFIFIYCEQFIIECEIY